MAGTLAQGALMASPREMGRAGVGGTPFPRTLLGTRWSQFKDTASHNLQLPVKTWKKPVGTTLKNGMETKNSLFFVSKALYTSLLPIRWTPHSTKFPQVGNGPVL